MSEVFIIAEAACTWHIGKSAKQHLANALKCIRVAQEAGADACKFQFTSDPAKMAQRRHIADLASYDRLAWAVKWLPILAGECEDAGIEFMCSAYLPQDVATIAPFVKRFKVASLEFDDHELLNAIDNTRKPFIASTGAHTHEQVLASDTNRRCSWRMEGPIGPVGRYGNAFLQCTSSYPCALEHLNLRRIRGRYIGLSDHSGDVLTGAVAVACGAEIIEVHFRLDETRPDNPDFTHSHSPMGLRQYILNIRKTELMLGDGVKRIMPSEQGILKHRVTA